VSEPRVCTAPHPWRATSNAHLAPQHLAARENQAAKPTRTAPRGATDAATETPLAPRRAPTTSVWRTQNAKPERHAPAAKVIAHPTVVSAATAKSTRIAKGRRPAARVTASAGRYAECRATSATPAKTRVWTIWIALTIRRCFAIAAIARSSNIGHARPPSAVPSRGSARCGASKLVEIDPAPNQPRRYDPVIHRAASVPTTALPRVARKHIVRPTQGKALAREVLERRTGRTGPLAPLRSRVAAQQSVLRRRTPTCSEGSLSRGVGR
jgi:hypothetical protein